MLDERQKNAAQAIVNIFETGKTTGDYGAVTVSAGDAGHLTYGRAQTTLGGGGLYELIDDYCDDPAAALGAQLSDRLERLLTRDTALDRDKAFKTALRRAGDDPVMRAAQDRFFDRVYWDPSRNECRRLGIVSALGAAVVYDSHIHRSWARLRDRTTERHGACTATRERIWLLCYVKVRRAWLANHRNRLLRKTTYRMDAFLELMSTGNWDLETPFTVRGVRVE